MPDNVRDHRHPSSSSSGGSSPGPNVRDHRGETGSGWGDGVVRDHRHTGIEHVFVLMLENRSFDHMLGFSNIHGTDADTQQPTAVRGLTGTESSVYHGHTYTVQRGAANVMAADPGHEFEDVLTQMCGEGATYASGGAYPTVTNAGYVAAFAKGGAADPSAVMACYTPEQLPVLNALAREFAVCDNWCASLPGPTWPNRMFAFAASSAGLDHSPSDSDIARWELAPGGGFEFPHGNIFQALARAGRKYRIYAGDHFPMAAALKGISIVSSIREYEHFDHDVHDPAYDASFTFIEPSYDVFNDYRDGTSQHPLGNVVRGEALIKLTYESIRKSPLWPSSVLIVTWDEHGGFYDHAVPQRQPHAVAPEDTQPGSEFNQHGFTFEQFGPRVPAIVVSPLIPRNLIDHRPYDHSSIPATIERVFGLDALTRRDAVAGGVNILASLSAARTDAPMTLPAAPPEAMARVVATHRVADAAIARPAASVNGGNLPAILASAVRQDMELSTPAERAAIEARVRTIKTREQAREYMEQVEEKIRTRRAAAVA
jgi:phospholipase C